VERKSESADTGLPCIGWREWVALPDLGIAEVKAKVDTGARTSTLHAFEVQTFRKQGRLRVRFAVHPLQNRLDEVVQCETDVHDVRWVSDSGGHREQRVIILTRLRLGDALWPIEMTLTSRDTMRFRMLLGRTAMQKRYIVNPARSYLVGRREKEKGG